MVIESLKVKRTYSIDVCFYINLVNLDFFGLCFSKDGDIALLLKESYLYILIIIIII